MVLLFILFFLIVRVIMFGKWRRRRRGRRMMMMWIGWMFGVKGFFGRWVGCIKCCYCILFLNVFLLFFFVINFLGIINFFWYMVDVKNGSKRRRRRRKEGKKLECIYGFLESFLIMEIVFLVDWSRKMELFLWFDCMIWVDKWCMIFFC